MSNSISLDEELRCVRYERIRTTVADYIRKYLRIGIADCPNIGCSANSEGRCCAFAVCSCHEQNRNRL